MLTTPRPETPPSLRQQRKKYQNYSSYVTNRYQNRYQQEYKKYVVPLGPFFKGDKFKSCFHRETRCGGISGDGVESPRRQEVPRSSPPPPSKSPSSKGRVHNKSRKSMIFCPHSRPQVWSFFPERQKIQSSSSSSLSFSSYHIDISLVRWSTSVSTWWPGGCWVVVVVVVVVVKHFPSTSFCVFTPLNLIRAQRAFLVIANKTSSSLMS